MFFLIKIVDSKKSLRGEIEQVLVSNFGMT